MSTSSKIIEIVRKNEFPKTIVVVGPSYNFNYNTLIPRLIKECQDAGLKVDRQRFVQMTVSADSEGYSVMLITQDQLEKRTENIECVVIQYEEGQS